jgi:hypothetical protein
MKTGKNVTKSRANLKRSLKNPERDHPLGLWVNTEFFRKLTTREPRLTINDAGSNYQNRYLQLADLVLNGGDKKKRKAIAKKTGA